MKEVTFFIEDVEKLSKIKEIVNRLESKYKSAFKEFKIEYTHTIEKYCLNIQDRINEINNEFDKIPPAFTLATDNIIKINNSFFDKPNEHQEVIIMHELGHVTYPLFLKINFSDNFHHWTNEYMAWKYLSEIDSKLIEYEFKEHFGNKDIKLEEGLEKLADTYFKLNCFILLIRDEKIQLELKEINHILNDKLIELGLTQKSIDSFGRQIIDFLKDYDTSKDNQQKLSRMCRFYQDDLKDEEMRKKLKL